MRQKGKTIIVLAGLAAVTIHIINRLEYSRSTVRDLLSCTQNNYYEWRFGKIRYTKKGNGSPVLLLHDLTLGSSSYEFHKITDELAKEHEVFCVDLIGYGLSDKPDITYTNYLYVQMISDFIKNVIGRRCDIIASGDTAPVAVMACHNDSEIIRDLIMINPQNLFQLNQIPSKQTKILKFLLETPVLGTFIFNLQAGRAAMTKQFQENFFYNPYNIDENDILSYMESAHTPDHHSKHTYASYIARYTNTNIVHALKEINNNIFMISGEARDNSRTIAENYQYYNSAIESVFIPNTKQLPQLEKPKEVLDHLKTFLR